MPPVLAIRTPCGAGHMMALDVAVDPGAIARYLLALEAVAGRCFYALADRGEFHELAGIDEVVSLFSEKGLRCTYSAPILSFMNSAAPAALYVKTSETDGVAARVWPSARKAGTFRVELVDTDDGGCCGHRDEVATLEAAIALADRYAA